MPRRWRCPQALLEAIAAAPALGLVEEHVAAGGLGQQLLHSLVLGGLPLPRVVHAHARGYPSGRYGSQHWHRRECGLDVPAILRQPPGRARMSSTESLARELKGPILVLGASGFIGANLMHALLASRSDVVGTASREPAWRLAA